MNANPEHNPDLFPRDLEAFVPPRACDAHAHLFAGAHFRGDPPAVCAGPAEVGWATYQERVAALLPGRRVSGLFFGFPAANADLDAANAFVAAEAARDPASRALMLVRPEMDPEFIRESVRRHGFAGLKPYHLFAREQPTFEAAVPAYLPEEQVRVAHQEGLAIVLHLVRRRGLADPANQEAIRAYARRYPDARFILAHAARGFNPHHVVEGIGALRGLRNVWCDTSAVTECGAVEAIARTLGVDRLLFGTDFPVSHLRGRCVAIGDSFLWLSPENTDYYAPYGEVRPSLIGIEALRALRLSCLNLGLSDTQVQALFSGNFEALFAR